jgi:hypothetical protein
MASCDESSDPRETIKLIESNMFKVTDQIEKLDDDAPLEIVLQVNSVRVGFIQ